MEGDSLWKLAHSFKESGMNDQEMYALFDGLREKYEAESNEIKYNIILDTMDYISDWCPPDKKLFKKKHQYKREKY